MDLPNRLNISKKMLITFMKYDYFSFHSMMSDFSPLKNLKAGNYNELADKDVTACLCLV